MLAAGPAPTLERVGAPSNIHSTERSCPGASKRPRDAQDILLRHTSPQYKKQNTCQPAVGEGAALFPVL